jgi:hypothetical protein
MTAAQGVRAERFGMAQLAHHSPKPHHHSVAAAINSTRDLTTGAPMWKELLHHAMDHYRFGTIAREVSPGPAGETSPVLLWMHGAMASYSGDSAASLVDHELRTQDQNARLALLAYLRDGIG